jgi:hypothetical protein
MAIPLGTNDLKMVRTSILSNLVVIMLLVGG